MQAVAHVEVPKVFTDGLNDAALRQSSERTASVWSAKTSAAVNTILTRVRRTVNEMVSKGKRGDSKRWGGGGPGAKHGNLLGG